MSHTCECGHGPGTHAIDGPCEDCTCPWYVRDDYDEDR